MQMQMRVRMQGANWRNSTGRVFPQRGSVTGKTEKEECVQRTSGRDVAAQLTVTISKENVREALALGMDGSLPLKELALKVCKAVRIKALFRMLGWPAWSGSEPNVRY